jgi:hypothetical protein
MSFIVDSNFWNKEKIDFNKILLKIIKEFLLWFMSALQGMDMLMYSYAEERITLNIPLAWFEFGLELNYGVLSASMFPSVG